MLGADLPAHLPQSFGKQGQGASMCCCSLTACEDLAAYKGSLATGRGNALGAKGPRGQKMPLPGLYGGLGGLLSAHSSVPLGLLQPARNERRLRVAQDPPELTYQLQEELSQL